MLYYRARNECCTAGTKGTSHDNSTVPKRSLAPIETEGRTRPTSVFLNGNGLTDISVVDSAAATFSTNRSFSPRVRPFETSVGWCYYAKCCRLSQEPDVLRGMVFALSSTRGPRIDRHSVTSRGSSGHWGISIAGQALLYNMGFKAEDKCGLTMCTEIETRWGGVAILLYPYSSIAEIFPWREDIWTECWMAARFSIMAMNLSLLMCMFHQL